MDNKLMDIEIATLTKRIEALEQTVREQKKQECKYRQTIESLEDKGVLTCVVCNEETRTILPCHHRVCRVCVRLMGMPRPDEIERNEELRCPICRKEYIMDPLPGVVELVDPQAYSCPLGVPKARAQAFHIYMAVYQYRCGEWMDKWEDDEDNPNWVKPRPCSAPPSLRG